MLRHPIVATFALLTLILGCHGYRFFQDRIPNGAIVPHPCRDGDTWQGVGHLLESGGGERNPFGLDFHANKKIWDRTICLMDSDGDGLTNGQELGDPDCVWKIGEQPARTTELSHPGVCDPWNSPECKDKTKWVSCGSGKFECPAINDPGTKNYTYRLPTNTPVPSADTTYMCMSFDLPQDDDYHMVAFEPILDNLDVMHHIVLIGCEGEPLRRAGEPFICGMQTDPNCYNIIGVWSFGLKGECAHPDMGFRIGKTGYKKAIFQLHWNNPEERADYVDSSGVIMHLTKQLRPFDGGIMTVGQDYLTIPPGEKEATYTGVCSAECSRGLIKDDIKVPVAWNHMHGLGVSGLVEHIRDGVKLPDITYDAKYDYNSPVLHQNENPIIIKPGDELKTTCTFNSMSRTRTTFFGDGTLDEMCYAFITYFPKKNMPVPMCTAFREITQCAFNMTDEIYGCQWRQLNNATHPNTKGTHDLVLKHCSPHIGCRKECLPVVKEIKQLPCYKKGSVNDFFRKNVNDASDSNHFMMFYAALDSCDVEIALEDMAGKGCENKQTDTNDGRALHYGTSIFLMVLLSIVTMKQSYT